MYGCTCICEYVSLWGMSRNSLSFSRTASAPESDLSQHMPARLASLRSRPACSLGKRALRLDPVQGQLQVVSLEDGSLWKAKTQFPEKDGLRILYQVSKA